MSPRFRPTGGPVQEHELYIERQADHDAWQLVTMLDYAHLIAPRQMGKTSLLHRLARRLASRGWRYAYVDFSTMDPTNEQGWYEGLGRLWDVQLQPQQSLVIHGPNDIKPYLNQAVQAM